MPELWTVDEVLADLAALEPHLLSLPERERPVAAARWFTQKYGRERGAAVFVLFVRLSRWLVLHDNERAVDRGVLARLLSRLGAGGGDVSEVPQPIPPEDKPEG